MDAFFKSPLSNAAYWGKRACCQMMSDLHILAIACTAEKKCYSSNTEPHKKQSCHSPQAAIVPYAVTPMPQEILVAMRWWFVNTNMQVMRTRRYRRSHRYSRSDQHAGETTGR